MQDLDTPRKRYWKRNLKLVISLLVVWFIVSCVLGIFLSEDLNNFNFPLNGFPFGFWIAQQGSIYVFIILIFIYAWRMDRLDKDLEDETSDEPKQQ